MINYYQWMTKDARSNEQMRTQNEKQAADLYQAFRALAGVLTGFAAMVGTVFEKLRRRRLKKAAIKELRALDDRMLSDLGISRSEIQYVVKGLDREDMTQPSNAVSLPNSSNGKFEFAPGTGLSLTPDRHPRWIKDLIAASPLEAPSDRVDAPASPAFSQTAHASLIAQHNRIAL